VSCVEASASEDLQQAAVSADAPLKATPSARSAVRWYPAFPDLPLADLRRLGNHGVRRVDRSLDAGRAMGSSSAWRPPPRR